MQAVIALGHFCENHGPRVVFTCQPMRSLPSTALSREVSYSQLSPRNDYDSSTPKRYYGDCTRSVYDSEDRCNACSSLGATDCLLSNDHEHRTSYLSSQIALNERVYDRVRTACLRSLSCEVVAPSRPSSLNSPMKSPAGGIFIGASSSADGFTSPNASGHTADVLAEIARMAEESDGHLVFGDADTGYCFSLTFRLQDSKARGFLRLFSLIVVSYDKTYITNNFDFFLAALTAMKVKLQQLAAETFAKEMAGHSEVDPMRPEYASVANRMPAGWFRRRMTIDTDRNLQTITADASIWSTLHRQMMWTLRTQTLRQQERVMEGLPTQDMLVMMEMDPEDIIELALDHPNQHEITLQQLDNLKYIASCLCDRDYADFDLLIKHVVTGGQVVVECADKMLAKTLLLAVSNMLPIGCLRLNTYCEQYGSPFTDRFNLIGCPLGVDVPLSVSDVFLLRVTPESGWRDSCSLRGCRVEVRRRPDTTESRPQLVERFRQLLLDDEINMNVLDSTMRSTRDHWLSRAKMVYNMMEQRPYLQKRLNEDDILNLVKGCGPNDRDVLIFWQGGLSRSYREQVASALEQLPTEVPNHRRRF